MRCPLDVDVDLVMTERQGVEIDYCPTCRGVWLDRGELDKILDRAAAQAPAAAPPVGGHATGHVSGEGGHGIGPDPGLGGGYAAAPVGDDRDDRRRYGDEDRRYERDERGYGGDDRRYGDERGYGGEDRRYGDEHARYGAPGHDPRRRKRKESWLGDLLDFG